MKIIVVGGGAAGFFAAINIAIKHPRYEVTILEKTTRLLQKVKVSGGGRCNVTNSRSMPSALTPFYPRGHKKLNPVFNTFSSDDMVDWLNRSGIPTKTEEDLRMFPASDSSQTIIDCFLNMCKKYNVSIKTGESLTSLHSRETGWSVRTNKATYDCNKVVVATGSSAAVWKVVQSIGLEVTKIVPSLFTFNIKNDPRLKDLQGISFRRVIVKITGSKLREEGPLLITHWGLSGPAILKLSSWGAYELHSTNYQFEILVNYVAEASDTVRSQLLKYKEANPKRMVLKYPFFDLPKRFWERLVKVVAIDGTTTFGELSKKQLNKMVEELTQGRYQVNGKSTFKEEFVTAGGVNLSEINIGTFESKRFPGLFFAGEVLDIDGLTGGFNFQACWSAGWIISENI